jgi:hypothetical protein
VELIMVYSRLIVDPDAYTLAATNASSAVKHIESAGQHALKSLAHLARMGGDDKSGHQFAHAYDAYGVGIFKELGALCTCLSQMAEGLGQTGASHANAEMANIGSSPHSQPVTHVTVAVEVEFAHPVSAYGGTNIFPQGWTFIQDLVSETWPDGDTGKMRTGKAAWNALADDLDDAATQYISAIAHPLHGLTSPDIPPITERSSKLATAAKELAKNCRDAAELCANYADGVDKAHNDAGNEIAQFVLTTAAAIGISAILTPLTAGISDLVGGAAVVADAAITAGEVGETLGVLARLAPTLIRIGNISREASAMGTVFKGGIFLGKTVTTSAVWGVAGMYGDFAVHGTGWDPGKDMTYALVSGVFAETVGGIGEHIGSKLLENAGDSGREAVEIVIADIPDAVDEPIEVIVIDGVVEHPIPIHVKVGATGIKATATGLGTAGGAVLGQAVTGGVDVNKLPEDILKDSVSGALPILEK